MAKKKTVLDMLNEVSGAKADVRTAHTSPMLDSQNSYKGRKIGTGILDLAFCSLLTKYRHLPTLKMVRPFPKRVLDASDLQYVIAM